MAGPPVAEPESAEAKMDSASGGRTRGDWMDRVAKSAAILGAFVAVGQTASKTVESHYQQQIEEAKAKAEIEINKEKSESSLASDFLKIILDKNTSESDRVMVLDALRGLPNHPLQKWAQENYASREASLAAYERADKERLSALSDEDQQSRTSKELTAELTLITIEIDRNKNDQSKSDELRNKRFVLSQQLAQLAKAKASSGSESGRIVTSIIQSTATTSTFFGIPLERVKNAFAGQASGASKDRIEKNIDAYLPPLEACLRENGFVDAQTVAEIAGQIAHETVNFRTLVELGSGEAYEGRRDLGNTQPGDGPSYKGRGLLGLVGRANYQRVGEQLGVGDKFVQSPEDVLIPENAARIACFYFRTLGDRFREAARNGDSQLVRRMVNGGLNGLDDVRVSRSKFLVLLGEASTPK